MNSSLKKCGFALLSSSLLLIAAISVSPKAYAADSNSAASATSNAVVTRTADSIDVTIYGQDYGQVEETRTVHLQAGRNSIRLDGIANKYRPDSLSPITATGPGHFVQRSATYQPANASSDQVLNSSIGATVSATLSGGEVVTGTLQSVNNGQLVVTTSDGKTVVAPAAQVTVPTPAGLSTQSSLVVEADVTVAGDYKLNFLYETDGLGWEAKHSVVYDADKSVVTSWTTTVSVVNQTGTSFQNASVYLISGSVAVPQVGAMRAYAAAAAPGAGLAADAPASVESVGEQKVYHINDKVSLADSQTRQITLIDAANVPVDQEYYVPAQNRYYGQQANGQHGVSVRLNVKNCTANHMGAPLPSGAVKVYQRNSAGHLQQTGAAIVGQVASDESFQLNIGTSSDVKYETALTSTTQSATDKLFDDRTYETTIHNYKTDKAVTVTVEVAVPDAQQEVKPLVRKNANQANGTVTVAKNTSQALSYTLHVQVRSN